MPTLTFKVSAEEARKIRAAARREKRSLSAHLRAAALGEKKTPQHKVRMERHPVSGLYYNAAGKDLPPVSQEQVRELLADFP